MKSPLIPIVLGLGSLAGLIWLAWWMFEGQRHDVVVARAFLTHLAAEDYVEARALMTPDLAIQTPAQDLRLTFGPLEEWQRLRFPHRTSNGVDGSRVSELWGRGIAQSGCETELFVTISNGAVDGFTLYPLCPQLGTDI